MLSGVLCLYVLRPIRSTKANMGLYFETFQKWHNRLQRRLRRGTSSILICSYSCAIL